jgi:predicted nucleic acid-binding protein
VYLFDTSVFTELTSRRPNAAVVHKLMACDPALRYAPEMTRYELRYGAALLPPGNPMWQRIVDEVLPRCIWLPLDAEVCACTADLTAGLQRAGRMLDWADPFIAATALVHGRIIVTRNVRHFDRIEGLLVENWYPAE